MSTRYKEIHPQDLKAGMTFSEFGYGMRVDMVCVADPVNDGDSWTWQGRGASGELTDYLHTSFGYPTIYVVDTDTTALRDRMRGIHPLTKDFCTDQCLGEAYAMCTLGTELVRMDVDHALAVFCHLDDSKVFEMAANAPDGCEYVVVPTDLMRAELECVFELCEAREQGV